MASIFELEQPVFGREDSGFKLISGSTTANTVLTAEQTINSIIKIDPDQDRNVELPSAIDLIEEMVGCQVGTVFDFYVENESTVANDRHLTLTASSSSVELNKAPLVIQPGTTRHFFGRVQNISRSNESVVIFAPTGVSIPTLPRFQEVQQETSVNNDVTISDPRVTTIDLKTFPSAFTTGQGGTFTVNLPSYKAHDNLAINVLGHSPAAVRPEWGTEADGSFEFSFTALASQSGGTSFRFRITVLKAGAEVT